MKKLFQQPSLAMLLLRIFQSVENIQGHALEVSTLVSTDAEGGYKCLLLITYLRKNRNASVRYTYYQLPYLHFKLGNQELLS